MTISTWHVINFLYIIVKTIHTDPTYWFTGRDSASLNTSTQLIPFNCFEIIIGIQAIIINDIISAELQESATLQEINQSTLQTNKRTQIGSPWECTHNLSYKCFIISLTILVLVKWIPKRFQYNFFTNLAMTQTKFDFIELYMGINYSIKLFCILFNWIITEILEKYAKEIWCWYIIYGEFFFVVTLTEQAIIFFTRLHSLVLWIIINYGFNCEIFPCLLYDWTDHLSLQKSPVSSSDVIDNQWKWITKTKHGNGRWTYEYLIFLKEITTWII